MTSSSPRPPSGFEPVASMVARRTGLTFPESRWAVAEAGMRRVQKQTGARTAGAYLELLHADESAFEQLVNELTVGETYFLRDPAQFEFIGREVLPEAMSRRGAVRAWSAGCATGEEPYTLAILIDQMGHSRHGSVSGTDIAGPRLNRARRGLYGRWSLRSCPEPIVDRYFEKTGAGYRLLPRIRDAVRFSVLNLGEPDFLKARPDLRNMDLVLCRNVLIYLDPPTVARVAQGLLDALHDDGWLLLGASDPPLQELVPCRVEVTDAGLAYRRGRARRDRGMDTPASAGEARPPTRGDSPPTVAPARVAPRGRPGLRASRMRAAPQPRGTSTSREAPPPDASAAWREAADEAACVAELRALLNGRRMDEAEAMMGVALERYRESAEIAYLHAVLLSELGRHGDAVGAARRSLYLDRRLLVGHLALGVALAGAGDHVGADRALRNAERTLAALPADAVVPGADGVRVVDLLALVRARARHLATRSN